MKENRGLTSANRGTRASRAKLGGRPTLPAESKEKKNLGQLKKRYSSSVPGTARPSRTPSPKKSGCKASTNLSAGQNGIVVRERYTPPGGGGTDPLGVGPPQVRQGVEKLFSSKAAGGKLRRFYRRTQALSACARPLAKDQEAGAQVRKESAGKRLCARGTKKREKDPTSFDKGKP